MIGVEFVKDRKSKIPDKDLRERIIELASECGLILLGCGKSVIRIATPLCTSKSEVDETLAILEESLGMAEKEIR